MNFSVKIIFIVADPFNIQSISHAQQALGICESNEDS